MAKTASLLLLLALAAGLPCPAQAGDSVQAPAEIPGAGDPASMPPGTVHAWPVGSSVLSQRTASGHPAWLECDGSAFDEEVYPELRSALGKSTLPDMRGQFLAGYGQNGENPGIAVSGAMGAPNAARLYAHTHRVNVVESFAGSSVQSLTPDTGGTASMTGTTASLGADGGVVDPESGMATHEYGAEYRPKNMAVRYYVKAGR